MLKGASMVSNTVRLWYISTISYRILRQLVRY